MKDILSALIAITPTATATAANSTSRISRRTIVTRAQFSALVELRPSLFHSRHLTSLERFLCCESLFEQAQSREERISRIEEGFSTKENVEVEDTKVDTIEGSVVIDKSRDNDGNQYSLEKAQIAEEGKANMSVKDNADAQPSPPRRSASSSIVEFQAKKEDLPPEQALQAELFPELPVTASRLPVPSISRNDSFFTGDGELDREDASSGEEEEHERMHISGEEDKGQSSIGGHPSKTVTKQGKRSKKDRGRLGLWKVLTSILESPGALNNSL